MSHGLKLRNSTSDSNPVLEQSKYVTVYSTHNYLYIYIPWYTYLGIHTFVYIPWYTYLGICTLVYIPWYMYIYKHYAFMFKWYKLVKECIITSCLISFQTNTLSINSCAICIYYIFVIICTSIFFVYLVNTKHMNKIPAKHIN